MRRSGFSRQPASVLRFNVGAALVRAGEILRDPPTRAHIVRLKPVGELVKRFALPLELCEPQNRRRGAPAWAMANKREAILQLLANQLRHQLPESPLPGRPIVQCIRFSARATDAFSDSFKQAIDCLCPRRIRKWKGVPRLIPGLGLIADDRPEACDVRQRWEYAPRGAGFCVIEVYRGEVLS